MGSLFSFKLSPYGWYFLQHFGKAPFESFCRKFPTIYFGQENANHIDKGLQRCTSLAVFFVVIVGRRKEGIDVINDLITEDEDLLISCADDHVATLSQRTDRLLVEFAERCQSSNLTARVTTIKFL
jgi:hypothetical protein